MTTTFENARIGDRVWDFIHGFGEIEHIESKSEFPLKIRFVSGSGYTFTLKGQNLLGIPQTLFWDEIKFEAPTQSQSTKLIHGLEVPDISIDQKTTKLGWRYYYPEPSKTQLFNTEFYGCSTDCMARLENNLCYPYTEKGKQAAIRHAKAMLGIKE
jgi:hypothetical protein